MNTRDVKLERVVAWILIGVAVLPLLGSIAAFLSGGFYALKSMRSFFFASFFLGMSGWMLGAF